MNGIEYWIGDWFDGWVWLGVCVDWLINVKSVSACDLASCYDLDRSIPFKSLSLYLMELCTRNTKIPRFSGFDTLEVALHVQY